MTPSNPNSHREELLLNHPAQLSSEEIEAARRILRRIHPDSEEEFAVGLAVSVATQRRRYTQPEIEAMSPIVPAKGVR